MFSKVHSFTGGSLILVALLLAPASSQSARPIKTVDTSTTTNALATSPRTAHMTANLRLSYAGARSKGFNVFDVAGSTTNPAGVKTKLNALPAGTKAMIWVGNLGKVAGVEGFSRAQFQAQVNALATDPRVYGYYIADEPHPVSFPAVVAEIRARADYLRAKAPAQKSFIVVLDGTNTCNGTLGCEYARLAPANTHVSLIGVDVYPCHLGAACDFSKIPQRVNAAVEAGVPRGQIVPIYQTFGQEGMANPYYRAPSPAELQQQFAAWKASVPAAQLDYAYTWGTQSTSPQALINHPAQQAVVQAHNAAGTDPAATARYVTRVYADLFNRAPDARGLAGWSAALNSGTPRVAVANAITYSAEYRSKLITGSYSHYLGRTPDRGGLASWLGAMGRGMTIEQMESGFISSPEYYARAGSTSAGWVNKLYADVLGRSAAASGVAGWTAHIRAGMPRNKVAMGFLLSTERLATVVDGHYRHLLGRGIDPVGQRTWVGILQRGGRDEAIIGGIIASAEYYRRV